MEFGPISFGAFPRSGNHTLGTILAHSFPNREIKWLGHRITDLSKAENCCVVIRNPIDCVASWLNIGNDFHEDAPERFLDWYIRYMNGVIGSREKLAVFLIDDLWSNHYGSAEFVAEKFSLEEPIFVDRNIIEEWLVENRPLHFPNETSANKSIWNEKIKNSPSFILANSLYEKVLEGVDKPLQINPPKLREVRPWDLLNPKVEKIEKMESARRLDICRVCDKFVKLTTQCKECSCVMLAKTKLKAASCPLGKW